MKKTKIIFAVLILINFLFFPLTSSALEVGDKAPAFTAESNVGEISLADYAGNKHVVLALYFAVFSSVWSSELDNFQRDLEEFETLDAQIIGVSGDDMKTLQEFAEEKSIDFPLITDAKNEIKKTYGGGRLTYLIDKKGIIRFIQNGVPENDAFIEQLKALQE